MNDDLQKRIQQAMANPQNLGELANADAVATPRWNKLGSGRLDPVVEATL